MYKLNLVIPGFGTIPESGRLAIDALPAYATIDRFLRLCNISSDQTHGYEALLCELFGVYQDAMSNLPLGAMRRLGMHKNIDDLNYLCADPVSLQAGQRDVVLRNIHDLEITEAEARQLTQLFNEHYSNEGLKLTADTAMQWHLQYSRTDSVSLPPLSEVIQRKVNACLSAADQPRYWRNLINEVQMLFHNAQVNRTRAANNLLEINGLWLYGPGCLPAEVGHRWAVVYADCPLAAGLSRLSGAEYDSVPESFDDLPADDKSASSLVVLKQLQHSLWQDDFSKWQKIMESLDSLWFRPAIKALAGGGLKALALHDCAGNRYELQRIDLLRFWRRTRSIRQLMNNT